MNDLEKSLKVHLDGQVLPGPSRQVDDSIELLIENFHAKGNDNAPSGNWRAWSVAASGLLILVLFAYKDTAEKDPVSLAINTSSKLEQLVSTVKPVNVQPVFFIEVDKINRQIAQLDQQVHTLLLKNVEREKILELMELRIDKLNRIKELYQANNSAYRI